MKTTVDHPAQPGKCLVCTQVFAFVMLILLGSSALTHPASGSPRNAPRHELLVKCARGPAGEAARAADATAGCTQIRCFNALGWHLVRVPEGVTLASAMAKYRALPGVLAVEPNAILALEPPPRLGGTGDPPVPSGNLPDGTGAVPDESQSAASESTLPPIPPGGSPSGTGESPAPPESSSTRAPHAIGLHSASPTPGVIPNDPRFKDQWNLRIIGMTNAWAATTGSSNVALTVQKA